MVSHVPSVPCCVLHAQALAALHAYLDGIIDTTKKRRKKWPKSSAVSPF